VQKMRGEHRLKRTDGAKAREGDTPSRPEGQARTLPRLLRLYREEVVPLMMREFHYTSVMAVPRIEKVVINVGLGEAKDNSKALENMMRDIALIAGQRPVVTRARQAIAGFKVRKGQPIGLMVTLRGERMWAFLDRLFNAVLPRIRDFRGVPREGFDGRGNYSLGIREHIIFPEVDYNQVDRIRGLQVNITTTAQTDREAMRLLELLGMPFARPREPAEASRQT